MALMGGPRGLRPAVLAGAFVALFLVAVGVWLVLRLGVGVVHSNYTIVLNDVSGLDIGADVMVAGYKVGRVEAITPHFPMAAAEDATAGGPPETEAEAADIEAAADPPQPVELQSDLPVLQPVADDATEDRDDADALPTDSGRPQPAEDTECIVGETPEILRVPDTSEVYFVIDFSVDPGVPLPKDTIAYLAAPSPLGGPIIDLRVGRAPALLVDGARLVSAVEPSVLDELSNLGTSLNDVLQNALRCVEEDIDEELKAIVAEIGGFLDELQPEIAEQFEGIREDIQASVGSIETDVQDLLGPYVELAEETAPAVRQAVEDLSAAVSTLSELGTPETVAQVGRALDAATSALISARDALIVAAPTLQNLGGTLNQISPDLTASAADAQYLLQQLAASLNVTLLNLESASQELAGLIADIRANPASLITGGN